MSTFKWATEPSTPVVAFFHRRIRETVQERLAASGRTWEDAVFDPDLELSEKDFAAIEQELLDTGHRFEMSARISAQEAPEKYRDAGEASPVDADDTAADDGDGERLVGSGDNVFAVDADVVGTARIISSIDGVLDMLEEGVPDNTVAIIDDSGGTLTAPILEDFTAVICKGGTVRSHLGILTREYHIPCLMAAEIAGVSDGDTVKVEYTAAAVSPYADDPASQVRARIWKI